MFLHDISFTVFDTETTGLDAKSGDRIVEIAAVRVEGGVVQHEQSFTTLVNPGRPISPAAARVNKITDADLADAPTIENVLPEFLAFAEGSLLVAHNAEFDLSFLEAEKESCWGFIEIPECICTLALSRAVCPNEYGHNLDAVTKRFNLSIEGDRHRALPDVLLTAEVLLKLIELGNIQSLDELREKAGARVLA